MTTRRILKKLAAALLLPLLLLTACMSEELDGSQPLAGKEATVTFSLQLPGASKSDTRALSAADENEVSTIEVLQFEKNGGDYIRTTFCTAITTNGGDSRIKNFTVKLIKGEYDLMILANPRPRVKTGYTPGSTRQTVMDALYADLPAGDKWNADPTTGTAYSPIPMWGEVKNINIQDNTSLSGASAVQLARMVAKVNVQVTGAAVSKFLLKSVRVYNYNSRGSLVPAAANFSAAHIATAPTVPSGSELRGNPDHTNAAFKDPLVYDGTAITTANVASEGEIYLFESEVGSATSLSSNTCLVIGGQYDGAGVETFYRVDFANKSGNAWNYLPLLRNHKYIVDISTVSGKGFETPKDAFNSAPVNIEANVLEWNDGQMGQVIFDGQYYLSIKPEMVFNFDKDADARSIKVQTDVPEGWKIMKITEDDGTTMNSGWLTTDKTTGSYYGTGEVETTLGINVEENPSTTTPRTGYIYIKAGRLEAKLTVNQGIKPKKVPTFSFIEYINVDGTGTTVPLAGGTIQAKVNTNMGWALKTDKAGLDASMPEPTNEMPTDYTLSVAIPGIDGWGIVNTVVWVEYMGTRINQTTYKQTGYNITVTGAPTTVNKFGAEVILNLKGYFPAMNFRVVNTADVSKVVSNVVACTTTGSVTTNSTSTITLTVYPNGTGASRNIKFQYEKSPGVWADIATASQGWNGLFLPTTGVIAPPGVIGVGAETGKLTLDGSKEYPGGKAGETVYVVYFKWGSTVAISAGTGVNEETFDTTDVAWVPQGFTGSITNAWSSVPYHTGGTTLPAQNNATGLGDPCKLAIKNGVTGNYRMPTGNPYEQFTDGGWVNSYSSGINIPGHWSNFGSTKSQFYPAAGFRYNNTGELYIKYEESEAICYCWSATYQTASTAWALYTRNGLLTISGGANRANGYSVRCVPE